MKGKINPKQKLNRFIGKKGRYVLEYNEAIIEGKQLSGIGYDDVKFLMTIHDDGSVDFDEVDTNKTTQEEREQLLEVIFDQEISYYDKDNMVINDKTFKPVKDDTSVKLYLSVEYKQPKHYLSDLIANDLEISDEASENIKSLMSMFDDLDLEEVVDEEQVNVVSENNETVSNLEAPNLFGDMKQKQLDDIQSRLDEKVNMLNQVQLDYNMAKSKLDLLKSEVELLESRLDSLLPDKKSNGYYFFLSEKLGEESELDDATHNLIFSKVSKVPSINADAFMSLFNSGKFKLSLSTKNDNGEFELLNNTQALEKETLSDLIKLGFSYNDDEIFYVGDLGWGQLVNKLVKNGFKQDSEFNKICGSNSYSVEYDKNSKVL